MNEEFWEIYLHRHGDHNNKLKLACVFEKDGEQKAPFAGIASKMYKVEIDNLQPVNEIEVSQAGNKISDTQSLYQAVIDAGGDSDVISIKLPLDRIDCSSNTPIDFSSFDKLSTLALMGDDPSCIPMIEFNEDVNLVFVNPDSSSSLGRRLQSNVVRELNFVGSKVRSINIGNNMFNTINYKLRIESTLFKLEFILDCDNLKSIVIGKNAFSSSTSFRVINNKNLLTIDIGENSFSKNVNVANSVFELTSMNVIVFCD